MCRRVRGKTFPAWRWELLLISSTYSPGVTVVDVEVTDVLFWVHIRVYNGTFTVCLFLLLLLDIYYTRLLSHFQSILFMRFGSVPSAVTAVSQLLVDLRLDITVWQWLSAKPKPVLARGLCMPPL